MNRSLAEMQGHLVVCGYGRMGRLVCQEFASHAVPFVVVDKLPLADELQPKGGLYIQGDATSDEELERVGIRRARALVSVVASDADNLYITMSARLLNDKLFIVARADDERSQQKLSRAGANRVVSPYMIGGTRVAQAVLRPNVVDFLELATRTEHLELNIEEARLDGGSSLAGATLESSGLRQEHGLIIVGIKKASGQMLFNPPRDASLQAGDILIMLGKRSDLDRVAGLAQGQAR